MADTHTYNHIDIRRYLENQMTASEMHAFEKAMLDDPFLSDAFDGYNKTENDTAIRHLNEIQQAVRSGQNQARVVPLAAKTKTAWWRIAALVVVLAGAGIIIFQLTTQPVATTELAKASITQPAADSIGSAEPFALRSENMDTNQLAAIERLSSSSANEPGIFRQPARPDRSPRNAEPISLDSTTAYAMGSDLAKEDLKIDENLEGSAPGVSVNRNREFRGKVVNSKGEPLAQASVQTLATTAVTDKNGNFSIAAQDSLVNVKVSSEGFTPLKKQLSDNDANNKIVLSKPAPPPSEVEVVGYGRAKASANKPSPSASVDPANTTEASAEPEGGWVSFREYVYKQLKMNPDTTDGHVSGDVLVEFTIDEKGNPRNINVLPPAGKDAAAKAVELLEKGPRWKRLSKQRKAKVLLKF